MFSFLDYASEIFTVGKAQHVDLGVAFDKFRTDVRLGKAYPYNTGDALPGFDFAGTGSVWNGLTEDEQRAAYEEWNAFLGKLG